MTITPSRRVGLWVCMIASALCTVWLVWAWSPDAAQPQTITPAPARITAGSKSDVAKPEVAKLVPNKIAKVRVSVAPRRPARAAETSPADVTDTVSHERVPTPHPMSLDQARPPQQQGALRELKQQYAAQSRSADSGAREAKLRSMLSNGNIPAELIDTITCRRTMCKIETRWTPPRLIGYSIVYQSLRRLYHGQIAVEAAPAPDADGSYPTTLYFRVSQ